MLLGERTAVRAAANLLTVDLRPAGKSGLWGPHVPQARQGGGAHPVRPPPLGGRHGADAPICGYQYRCVWVLKEALTLACSLLCGLPIPLLFHPVFPILETDSDWEPQQVSWYLLQDTYKFNHETVKVQQSCSKIWLQPIH